MSFEIGCVSSRAVRADWRQRGARFRSSAHPAGPDVFSFLVSLLAFGLVASFALLALFAFFASFALFALFALLTLFALFSFLYSLAPWVHPP